MSKTYKVTVSMDDYETEVEDCESEDEALNIVLNNEVLGGGLLEFEVEEIDDAIQQAEDLSVWDLTEGGNCMDDEPVVKKCTQV